MLSIFIRGHQLSSLRAFSPYFVKLCSKSRYLDSAISTTQSRYSSTKSVSMPSLEYMKKLRNFGISAHVDSGKTTLTERILFYTGRIDKMHEVKGRDKIGAVMDFMDLERERGITIKSAATFVKWKNHYLNIIDTPGHIDFTIEVERALRVLDGAVLVVCGVGAVQSQTLTVNRQLNRYKVPFIVFVNKLDKNNSCPFKCLNQMKAKLAYNAALMQIPIGIGSNMIGIIDLVEEKAYQFEGQYGSRPTEIPIPNDMLDDTKSYRKQLFEAIANVDDYIGEMFLEDKFPTKDQIHDAIKRTVLARTFIPVFIGSAIKNRGIQPLLDGVIRYLPNPMEVNKNVAFYINNPDSKLNLVCDDDSTKPLITLAFKLEAGKHGQLTYLRIYQGSIYKNDTIYNTRNNKPVRVNRLVKIHANEMLDIDAAHAGEICAVFGVDCYSGDTFVSDKKLGIAMESMFIPEPVMTLSIEATNAEEILTLTKALARFSKEDPTFKFYTDSETNELIIAGMGELHLDIYTLRIKDEYKCNIKVNPPKVSYREKIISPVDFEYFHKKQSGGAGQYAKISATIEPTSESEGDTNCFLSTVPLNEVPKNYVYAVEKAFYEFCEKGPLSGSKVIGLKMTLKKCGIHIVDSNDHSFRFATLFGLHQNFNTQCAKLFEPMMSVDIVIPSSYHSQTFQLISKMNCRIKSSSFTNEYSLIFADISLRDMFGFTNVLRKVTQGKGEFTMVFNDYVDCDPLSQSQIIENYSKYKSLKFI